ncbi:MAG: uroporphyrinogen decarboxylase [Pseudomonadota bacterium]|nr:uroporphyrinogen decarboxylase [Pseudomonadota bacterium]
MTSGPEKTLLRALAGEATWPPPIWLMRQAGRYLPEYRALRARAGDFLSLCMSPQLAAEITLQPIRRFCFDAAILFSDILILPWALGHGLAFKEGEGPVLPQLVDASGVDALDVERLPGKVAPVIETVRRARAGLAAERPETALIGFAGAPFTVACYMVDGGGSKNFAATRAMAHGRPALFARLIDRLTVATIAYLAEQIDAGAEAVMLFDSWSGILSPRQFQLHVVQPTTRIVDALRQRFPAVPIIGFPRLAGLSIGAYAGATGVDAVGMDTGMDPALVRTVVPPSVTLQGNLDPLALLVGGTAMAEEARSVLSAMQRHPFVFNLGHGFEPQTPPEHVAELVRLVRAG